MSNVKIESKITGISIKNKGSEDSKVTNKPLEKETVEVHKPLLKREDSLEGVTYKIKTPSSEHAFYITINDLVTIENGVEKRVPFEMFINTKNMEHYMWIVALTRVVSAIFRKGDDLTFLVEELKAIFDPNGGYYKKGIYIASLVAEIGSVIESHLKSIGQHKEKDQRTTDFIKEKRDEFQKRNEGKDPLSDATLCTKCHAKSVILLDNCMTCLECGDSKCG